MDEESQNGDSFLLIEITVKYSGKCVECNEWIQKGERAFWLEGEGIKHLANECIIGFREDDSRLVVIESDEEFWLK